MYDMWPVQSIIAYIVLQHLEVISDILKWTDPLLKNQILNKNKRE